MSEQDVTPQTAAGLGEDAIKEAIKALSWPTLEAHLRSRDLDAARVARLVDLVRTNEATLFKRSHSKQCDRDQMLQRLGAFLADAGFEQASSDIGRYAEQLCILEDGFASILKEVAGGSWAGLEPAVRVHGALQVLADEHRQMQEDLERSFQQAIEAGPTFAQSATLTTESGRSLDPEVALGAILSALMGIILIEAHEHRWFDADGTVRLPASALAPHPATVDLKPYLRLAFSWNNWDAAQLAVRFRKANVSIEEQPLEASPTGPANQRHVIVELDADHQLPDFIANERLVDRAKQDILAIFHAKLPYSSADGDTIVSLPPKNFINEAELLAVESFEHMLSIDVGSHQQQFQGLTLPEWVRGYALLHAKAIQHPKTAQDTGFPVLSVKSLAADLQRIGLSPISALRFIDNVSLKRYSRDAFDHPLIRTDSDQVVLVDAAVRSSLIAPVVLSAIAAARQDEEPEQIRQKGFAFEKRMRDLFSSHGLNPASFTVKRDGQEFEFDLLVVWDDYLFLFECKNRLLSSNHATAAYYFEKQINGDIRQVKRLADALARYPDILSTHLPQALGKRVVPCVVNALPYALFGGRNGVFFADESAIARFFKSRYIGVTTVPGEDQRPTGELDIQFDQWEDQTPRASDLVRNLIFPIQYAIAARHSEVSNAPTYLGQNVLGHFRYLQRTATTPESLARTFEEYPQTVARAIAALKASEQDED